MEAMMGFNTPQVGKGTLKTTPLGRMPSQGFGRKEGPQHDAMSNPQSPFHPKNAKTPTQPGEPIEGFPGFSMVGSTPVRDACGHIAHGYKEKGTCRHGCE